MKSELLRSTVLALWIGELALDVVLAHLNLGAFLPSPPAELTAEWSELEYGRSRSYMGDRTRFALISHAVSTGALIAFLFWGGFERIDQSTASLGWGPVATGLAYFGELTLLRGVLQFPFSVFETFRLEAEYGFNRTTFRTFLLDRLKGLILGSLLGGALLAGVLAFFNSFPATAWLWSWAFFTAFSIGLSFLAPAFLLPLFNKFEPIPEGALRQAIRDYAKSSGFDLQGVFVMDASKRSSKSNAFFIGFGKYRKLVLFDTLIKTQSVEEIVAVVAHEAGHFQLGHIPRTIATRLASSLVLFYFASVGMRNETLFQAFGMSTMSVHAGLVIVSLIYSPLGRFLSVFPNGMSRRFEYEADAFAVSTYGNRSALSSALKKLHRENFAHLTPHPLKVFFDYTHPPVLDRIRALMNSES